MFPFGVSFQEIAFLAVLLTVAGGYKKEFFQYSRSGGKFVGRAVGFIRNKRDQVFTSSGQRKELDALQQQLGDAMSQMQNIRYDIRSSTRILPSQQQSEAPSSSVHEQPPPNRTSGLPFNAADPLAATEAAEGQQHTPPPPNPSHSNQQSATSAHAGVHPTFSESRTSEARDDAPSTGTQPSNTPLSTSTPMNPHEVALHSPTARQAEGLQPQRGSSVHAASPSSRASHGTVSAESLAKFDSIELGDRGGQLVYIDGVPLIPVSAEAAGKIAKTKPGAANVAEIMEAAMAEQLVARKAASFFKPGSEGD